MLGAITGDTVGSIYEFNNTRNYNFRLFTFGSNYTDDTVMSMAVARWLLDDPDHTEAGLEKAMVTMANAERCPMGGYGGMFYCWLFEPETLAARTGFNDGKRHPYGSWGNGSAMRASACGWFFDTLEETEHVAALSAAITHNDPEGIKGAQATAAAIWMARNGKSKAEIREYIGSRFGYDLSGTWAEYNRTYHWEDSCQGTVPPAIVCFLESTDFEDSIRKSVSIGGDSDTLACINGGIAEAFYGGVPEEIAKVVTSKLPAAFKAILADLKARTAYGRLGQKPVQHASPQCQP